MSDEEQESDTGSDRYWSHTGNSDDSVSYSDYEPEDGEDIQDLKLWINSPGFSVLLSVLCTSLGIWLRFVRHTELCWHLSDLL